MDLVAQWLAERCTRDPASLTQLEELTADFNAWAKDDLSRAWPNTTLSEKLGGLALEIRRMKKGMACVGLRLEGTFDAS